MTKPLRTFALFLALLSPSTASSATVSFAFSEPIVAIDGATLVENRQDLPTTPLAEMIGRDIFRLDASLFSFGLAQQNGTVLYSGSMFVVNSLATRLTLGFESSAFASASVDINATTGSALASFERIPRIAGVDTIIIGANRSAPDRPGNLSQANSAPFEFSLDAGQSARIEVSASLGVNTGAPPDAVQSIVNARFTLVSLATTAPPPPPPPQTPAVIPLPASAVLLLTSMSALGLLSRRRMRQVA